MKDKPRDRTEALDISSERTTSKVAEGDANSAVKIEDQAAREDIPLDQDGALTELLGDVPKENEIPENLYIAMAEILSYLHGVEESLDSSD